MTNRRLETKSSRTASYTCFSRGCATREKDPRFRGPDTMAELLFPPLVRLILDVAPLRQLMIQKMFPPGIHEYVLARTRVMDKAFIEALELQFDQIILLGAGFDTRAIRFSDSNHGTKIFELDAPNTQKAKLGVLQKKRIPIPENVIFADIDFDNQDIHEILSVAGFMDGKKNLFLWEGVTMYLNAQAIDNTLEFIRNSSSPGSRLVFDYIYASVLRRENSFYGEKEGYDLVASVGETWSFGLEDGEISDFLKKRGFTLVNHFTPKKMEESFLTKPDGTLHARVNGTHCIAITEVI
ncbi:MAG: SAM-dependent methyltransferase [Candidatus Aminicenantes bacterium]|nr:SAM-dependent methyltransferase [Candidatus Aminicenantes bacterium]